MLEPAIREIVSSIRVPPRSLAPPCSIACVPATPSLTQLVWMLSIRPCSMIRASACAARLSRNVGPGRDAPARYSGDDWCTNGSSTNSVKPPVRSWIPRSTFRCPTQWCGWSTWPYIIVELDRSPTSCAVVTTSIHSAVGSLPLVSTQRTSSSRISAAVPGIVSRPASRNSVSQSRTDTPLRETPLAISIGEKACTCIDGTRSLTARTRSA